MKEVRVSEVFILEEEGKVALIVYDGFKLKTIRMKYADYVSARIAEGSQLTVREDRQKNIIGILPVSWISVTQDRAQEPNEPEAYDYKHEYI